ncbi:MAG: hypothetical protein HFJ79_02110 [Clostridiales bacterium]|jgi:hypothetical protein|nr:hypothetical protein [Clostridiales bacterium]
MLTMVCVQNRQRRGLVQWIKSGFHRPDSTAAHFVTAGSGRYLRIDAYADKKRGIDWEAVKRAAGREAGRLLLTEGVFPPAGCGLGVLRSEGLLQRLMMQQTALWLLKKGTVDVLNGVRRIAAAVYDPAGYMPDLPVSLVPYAADVRVVTGRPEAYRYAQSLAMEEYGASIAVTGDAEALNAARLILALQPLGKARPAGKRLILAAFPSDEALEEGVAGNFLPNGGGLVGDLPSGIDTRRFLEGLYEVSGVRDMAAALPVACELDGRDRPLRDLLQRLPGLDITVAV